MTNRTGAGFGSHGFGSHTTYLTGRGAQSQRLVHVVVMVTVMVTEEGAARHRADDAPKRGPIAGHAQPMRTVDGAVFGARI